VDDVINVAGDRLAPKEIESAALTVPRWPRPPPVPVIDDIRGPRRRGYVSLKPGFQCQPGMVDKVTRSVEVEIGKIARRRTSGSSRTCRYRSGKIMRG